MREELPRLRPQPLGRSQRRGGAWKVAYADFVTALMALFIVMWLMNTSKQIQQAVAAYFRDPRRSAPSTPAGREARWKAEPSLSLSPENAAQLKQQLETTLRSFQLGELGKMVQISITAEGLRVELLETEQGLFFESGRPEPSPQGKRVLALLARELRRLDNSLVIEGHTDARPYRFSGLYGYSNWELSADRANAARRVMQDEGIPASRIAQIRGFADKRLLNPDDPYDSRNRRVSVVVQYKQQSPDNSSGLSQQESTPASRPAH